MAPIFLYAILRNSRDLLAVDFPSFMVCTLHHHAMVINEEKTKKLISMGGTEIESLTYCIN